MFFPTLSVYAIMRNEITNLDEFVAQFKNADHVVLLDTGSDDGTFERARELATKDDRLIVERALIDPFNFSTARNMAMKIAQDNVAAKGQDRTVFMWADLDERFEQDWYTKLVDWFQDQNMDCIKPWALMTNMAFHVNEQGAVLMTYPQRKIHTSHGFYWNYACHEVLEEVGEARFFLSHIIVRHLRDNEKQRNYLDILEAEFKAKPQNLRCLFYYGRELYYQDRPEEAIRVLSSCNQATESVTTAQMVECYVLGGDISSQQGNTSAAEHFFLAALSIDPNCCIAMYYLCRECYHKGDTSGQLYWGNKAIKALENAHINVIYNRRAEIAWQLYDFVALAYDREQKYSQALQYYAVLLQDWQKTVPSDDIKRIQTNVEYLVSQIPNVQPAESDRV